MEETQEISFLQGEVVKKAGFEMKTSNDFERLSVLIEKSTGQLVSVSTLKRLWGYVNMSPKPRTSTLDILAQYIGRIDYVHLCLELQQTSDFFISAEKIQSASLKPGDKVILSWLPDRTVSLEYSGNNHYLVIDGGTSKLKPGDIFESSGFIKNQPLYITGIMRNGEELPPYVAGKAMGLTEIEIH